MSQTSPRLALPYIQPAQAQKHVTHNEAIQRLDAAVQLVLSGLAVLDPPAGPGVGDVYALGAAPTGDWTGQGGQLAIWQGDGWYFLAPFEGWRAWVLEADQAHVFRQGAWRVEGGDLGALETLGIGTTADAVNRLAVAAQATLLTHDASGGHQLKLNKATAADTVSLVFQTGFDGRAEMGLAGDDAFAIKARADAGAWAEMMRLDPAAQSVTVATGGGTAARLTQLGLELDRAPGGVSAWHMLYDQGNVIGTVSQSGGVATGALFESGSNANGTYSKFADGTLICTVQGFELDYLDSATIRNDWTFPHSFIDTNRVTMFGITRSAGNVASPTNYRSGIPTDDTDSASFARLVLSSSGTYTDNGPLTVSAMAIGRWF